MSDSKVLGPGTLHIDRGDGKFTHLGDVSFFAVDMAVPDSDQQVIFCRSPKGIGPVVVPVGVDPKHIEEFRRNIEAAMTIETVRQAFARLTAQTLVASKEFRKNIKAWERDEKRRKRFPHLYREHYPKRRTRSMRGK